MLYNFPTEKIKSMLLIARYLASRNMALERLQALENYLEQCREMDTFKDILAAQATTVAKEINDLQKLSIDAAAPLVAMIQQSKSWTPELKQSLCSTINLKVEETMSGKSCRPTDENYKTLSTFRTT